MIVDLTAEIVTVLCKEPCCIEEAEDTRGRYAKLCRVHKAERIEGDREHLRSMARQPKPRVRGALGEVAGELRKQALRVERASKKLDDERAELRRVYLRFGVEAGFLNPRD